MGGAGQLRIRDALRDVHVYRDALRIDGRVCDSALGLVPRVDPDVARYAGAAYRATHAFGLYVVRPSHSSELTELFGAPARLGVAPTPT